MKIRIMSYNIHKGFSLFNREFTLEKMRTLLRRWNPDVVLLQEVVGRNTAHEKRIKDWPNLPQFEYLAESFWPFHIYGQNAYYGDEQDFRHHGNAILSKFPIQTHENISISNHRFEQRGLLHAVLETPDHKKLHVFNVHLDLTHWGRSRQLDKIIARGLSHTQPNDSLILAGDFNDWQRRLSPQLFNKLNLRESFKLQSQGYAKTFPSFKPLLSLDRIYFRNLSLRSAQRIVDGDTPKLSDHIPLFLEFEVPHAHRS
jgi:endonuclease/exonuclease/phosphatase family metal-dependent hydrolase